MTVWEGKLRSTEGPHELRCPFCRAGIVGDEDAWVCPGCATAHHEECARETGACTVFGCGRPVQATDEVVSKRGALARSPRFLAVVEWGLRLALVPILLLALALVRRVQSGPSFGDPPLVAILFVGITVWGVAVDRVRTARARASERRGAPARSPGISRDAEKSENSPEPRDATPSP